MEATHKTDQARKRGRPRTNIESQEVLERRRKQLRIAQQAYRTRKANIISTLQERVHELECGIEELSQSFLAFSNLLIGTDLLGKHPHVTLALRKITQQYVSLAKTGCANPDEGTPNEAASIPLAIVDQGEKSAVEEPADEAMEMDDDDVPDFFKESVSHSILTSNKFTPTGLSSTSTQWPELVSLFTQPPPYKGQATPTVGVAMAPPTLESLTSLSPSPSPSATFSLPSSMKEEQWNFSQHLVKVCCQNAYQLLVTTPNDVLKIQQVFGPSLPSLPPTERNNLISCLRAGMQDRTGDLIDYMATVIGRLNCNGESTISEGLAASPEVWNLAGASEAGEWLDANGVQRFLSETGFYSQGNSTRLSSWRLGSSLKIALFVQLLVNECICFGDGPAFRRQTVEAALGLARKS